MPFAAGKLGVVAFKRVFEPYTQSLVMPKPRVAPLPAIVGRVVGHLQIAQGALGVVHLALEVIALRDHREVQPQAGAHDPAPLVAGMAACGKEVAVSTQCSIFDGTSERSSTTLKADAVAIVCRIDFVCRGHDLGAAPGLVEPDIADNVGHLFAAVAAAIDDPPNHSAAANSGARGNCKSEAGAANGVHFGGSYCNSLAHANDLRHPTLFRRDRGRQAVAELGGISPHPPAGVGGVFTRLVSSVANGGPVVEVIERLGDTSRDARPLDEGAVEA